VPPDELGVSLWTLADVKLLPGLPVALIYVYVVVAPVGRVMVSSRAGFAEYEKDVAKRPVVSRAAVTTPVEGSMSRSTLLKLSGWSVSPA
jgi:hypothetical protein